MLKLVVVGVLILGLVGWTQLPANLTAQSPVIGGCPMFPLNNVWNTPVDKLPVDSRSANYISSIGAITGLHPDFGTVYNGAPNGIPYITVPQNQTPVTMSFTIADESDAGKYPIPPNAPIEGGPNSTGDRHVLVVQQNTCKLFETWDSHPQADGSWLDGSGAIFDLNSNNLRPDTWTSADAAGLPILPGLARHDEVASGIINHALRFTVVNTRNSYIWPARHKASSKTNPNFPPMGQRFRLKASFDISGFKPDNQVILTALKKYGMIVADNGSNWYISGAPDPNWNDDDLANLNRVKGSDFEAVDESSLQIDPNSAAVNTTFKVSQGGRQGAVINQPFPYTLKTWLGDSYGDGFIGATVTFVASANGPGGIFAGGATAYITATTAGGYATSLPIMANNQTGNFVITATLSSPGLAFAPVVFQMTNLTDCQPAYVNPFIVKNTTDDGAGTACNSLSRAIIQAKQLDLIKFGINSPLTVTGALPALPPSVTLQGSNSCDPNSNLLFSITGQAGRPGLTVQGGTLKNLLIHGFDGPQVRAVSGGGVLECVHAKPS